MCAALLVVVLGLAFAVAGSAVRIPRYRRRPHPAAHPATAALVRLTQINNLPNAITMATRPGDDNLYVGAQTGQIYAIPKTELAGSSSGRTLVLDLSGLVKCCGEQGLLGMTFSLDGTKLYVHYTAPAGNPRRPRRPSPSTRCRVRCRACSVRPLPDASCSPTITRTPATTTAGRCSSGPTECSTSRSATVAAETTGPATGLATTVAKGNGQSLQTLLGKILRIDPTPSGGHGVHDPAGNPFVGVSDVGGTARGEIWSFGLRNPFRMSFDRTTGDLWIGDVGQAHARRSTSSPPTTQRTPGARARTSGGTAERA